MCSKTPYLAPSPKASESKFFTRILLAIVLYGFSRGGEEEEVLLNYFTRILLAMKGRKERGQTYNKSLQSIRSEFCAMADECGFLLRASSLFLAPDRRRG
jgi:hypothetical protein